MYSTLLSFLSRGLVPAFDCDLLRSMRPYLPLAPSLTSSRTILLYDHCPDNMDTSDQPEPSTTTQNGDSHQESHTQSHKPQNLMDFPQELLDIIFDLAYPRLDGVTYIRKLAWDNREVERKRSDRANHTKQPFPSAKVNQFLVSKRFFVLAAKAFVANQAFGWNLNFAAIGMHGGVPGGIVHEFLTEVTIGYYDVFWAVELPSLKAVTMQLCPTFFEFLGEDVCVWQDALTDDGIERAAHKITTASRGSISSFRGLRDFQAEPRLCWHAKEDWQRDMWRANVEKFAAYVRTLVTQPRGEPDELEVPQNSPYRWASRNRSRELRHVRLYTNSEVSFGTSTLYAPFADHSSDGESYNGSENETLAEDWDAYDRPFQDCDIPDDAEELKNLCVDHLDQVAEWMRNAKKRLELLEAQPTEQHPVGVAEKSELGDSGHVLSG